MATAIAASATASAWDHWPEGVVMRFINLAGATVDVTGSGRPNDEAHHWRCTGCDDSSPDRGDYLSLIRRGANQHAGACRALPRPGA